MPPPPLVSRKGRSSTDQLAECHVGAARKKRTAHSAGPGRTPTRSTPPTASPPPTWSRRCGPSTRRCTRRRGHWSPMSCCCSGRPPCAAPGTWQGRAAGTRRASMPTPTRVWWNSRRSWWSTNADQVAGPPMAGCGLPTPFLIRLRSAFLDFCCKIRPKKGGRRVQNSSKQD